MSQTLQGHVGIRRQVGFAVSVTMGTALALLAFSDSSGNVFRGRRLAEIYDDASYRSGLSPPTSYLSETGAVSVHQLLQLISSAGYSSPQAVLKAMAADREPSLSEFQAATEDLHWPMTRQQAAATFRGLDANEDGKVTLDELLGVMQRGDYYFDVTAAATQETHLRVGNAAEDSSGHQYDCGADIINWRLEWSDAKKRSCSLISAHEMQSRLNAGITGDQVFHLLDGGSDGVVSKEDWVYASSGMSGPAAPFAQPLSEPQAEFAFTAMDSNQDNSLSHDELVASLGSTAAPPDLRAPLEKQRLSYPYASYPGVHATSSGGTGHTTAADLKQRLEAKWTTLSNAFEKMDVDDQHTLDIGKLQTGLALLTPPIGDHADLEHIFSGLDTIPDGKITPPEFHGTLQIGHFYQTKEAVQQVLGYEHDVSQVTATATAAPSHEEQTWLHHSAGSAVPADGHVQEVPESEEARITLPQLLHSLTGTYNTADDAFHHMDQDGDGFVDPHAFAAGLQTFSPPVDAANAQWAFNGIDSNRDSEVTLQEFKDVLGTQISSTATHHQFHSSAEVKYRSQAREWAGTMQSACERMGLHEGNSLQLHVFKYASKQFEPLLSDKVLEDLFHQMDCDGDQQISPSECYLGMSQFKEKLSAAESVRNLFCDSDANNDHKLSAEEFDHFGKLLDPHCSGAKYAAFFHDELDQNHDGSVALGEIEALGNRGGSSHIVLSDEDLEAYSGIPAIIEGKSSVEVENSGSLTASKVGAAFATALGKELDITVEVGGEQALPSNSGMQIFVVLYTSRSSDGAATLKKLRASAAHIESEVEAAIIATEDGGAGVKATVWSRTDFSFYGPKAADLPGGQKISKEWGRKLGDSSDNASPPTSGD